MAKNTPSLNRFEIRHPRWLLYIFLIILAATAYLCLDYKIFRHINWTGGKNHDSNIPWFILTIVLLTFVSCVQKLTTSNFIFRAFPQGIEISTPFGGHALVAWVDVMGFSQEVVPDYTAERLNKTMNVLRISFRDSINLGNLGLPLAYPKGNAFFLAESILPATMTDSIELLTTMRRTWGVSS